MNVGFGLPIAGPDADPEGIIEVATRAERLGYDSVWSWERLFVPLDPQTGYVGTPDGSYPDYFDRVMDPFDVLSFVAAHTSTIRLGTSIAVMGHYHPLTFARRCATIDVLSGGRLTVGLGIGWSKDEHDAMGVEMTTRGERADEFLDLVTRAWTQDVVEYHGRFFDVPPSRMGIKPVQAPHPPILLAAFSPAAMRRIAVAGDGWAAIAMSIEALPEAMETIRAEAASAGRNPASLTLTLRANVHLTDGPLDERFPFVGSWDQVLEDIALARDVGVDELIIDPQDLPPHGFLEVLERCRPLVAA